MNEELNKIKEEVNKLNSIIEEWKGNYMYMIF